jgi:hypothetical protein
MDVERRSIMEVRTVFGVEIEAPDGASALQLELRLGHLAPTTVAHGSHWVVGVPAVRCPAELEAVVREWLDEIGEPATEMRVDGHRVHVTGRSREPRPARISGPNADFIG